MWRSASRSERFGLKHYKKITKNQSKPQQFVSPQGSSGGAKKIQ